MFKNREVDWTRPSEGKSQEMYQCTCCQEVLFSGDKKFDSKTGFPSFWGHEGNNVQQKLLQTYGRDRIQLICNTCGQHLGHLFKDQRTPSQVRYCINAESIKLKSPFKVK